MAARDDRLAAVHRRAAQLRRRRASIAALPLTAIVAAAAVVGVRARDSSGPTVRVAGRSATSTTHVEASSTTIAATATTTIAPTTTALVCHDSTKPACGPFRWASPPAADQPMRVAVAATPRRVAKGAVVTVLVSITDPDAVPICATAATSDGIAIPLARADGRALPPCVPSSCGPSDRYGPWDPPAPNGGTVQVAGTLTDANHGTHIVTVAASSGKGCAYQPYGSAAGATTQYRVG